jgi:hypothetical protein
VSFRCVVQSAYYVDRADEPIPNKQSNWERTRIDVLVHGGKALITSGLFGGTTTREFFVLESGVGKPARTLLWHLEGLNLDDKGGPTVLLHIGTWGGKDASGPIRFYLDYFPDVMLGTCQQVFGRVMDHE